MQSILIFIFDFFKSRSPKVFAIVSVGLISLLALLSSAINKGLICSDWEKAVNADFYVHVTPGDSVDLNTYIPDSLDGAWVNEDDGLILGDEGGIQTYIYQAGIDTIITVATNTCFVNDKTGILSKILFWLTTIVLALTGVHTTDAKKQILAQRKSPKK